MVMALWKRIISTVLSKKNELEFLNKKGLEEINLKILDLKIIFRSCTAINIMGQNKQRLFECQKNEYTFRSLNSILKSVKRAK